MVPQNEPDDNDNEIDEYCLHLETNTLNEHIGVEPRFSQGLGSHMFH